LLLSWSVLRSVQVCGDESPEQRFVVRDLEVEKFVNDHPTSDGLRLCEQVCGKGPSLKTMRLWACMALRTTSLHVLGIQHPLELVPERHLPKLLCDGYGPLRFDRHDRHPTHKVHVVGVDGRQRLRIRRGRQSQPRPQLGEGRRLPLVRV
jgi:hypothetical protein